MKRTLSLLSLLLMICTLPAISQEKNKEMMVKKIFSALQHKDEKAFVGLFPDAATTREFIIKLYGKDLPEGDEKKKQLDELTAAITDSALQMKLIENFKETIENGERKGFEWSATQLQSYLADSSYEEESATSVLKGKIYFTAAKKDYFLSYDEVIWFENLGWYGVDISRIDEKAKENEPEEFVWDGAIDSTHMLMDTALVAVAADTTIKNSEKQKPAVNPKPKTKQPEKQKPARTQSTPGLKPE